MPGLLAITAFPILLALTVTLITSCNAEAAEAAEPAMQLVSYEESGRYKLHELALHIIERLPPPVRVLAVVGDARIGKSTFLNMFHLHWDLDSETLPFEVGSTTEACTRGLWVHVYRLPEDGSLVLVDVEGDNLGDDAVIEQLSALTAVMSSYILLFVRQMVNNAALEFLYHTTKLGKMFPDSDSFPHLGVAIRDALDLSPKFSDRQSEVVHSILSPTHKDKKNDIRRELAAVFSPSQITAFEVQYQDRKQLENLQKLKSGPYYDSVMKIITNLKKTVPAKWTPRGMVMCGGDLVKMIRNLFTALENGSITVLETAFERLEKQMCDEYYSEWIPQLLIMSENDFMNSNQHHLEEFTKQCKIDSYVKRVQQEIESKINSTIREREEREKRKKAEEEKKKAEEEKKEEAQRKAEEERRRQEALNREAQFALIRAEEEKKRLQEQKEYERKLAEERQNRALEQLKHSYVQEQLQQEKLQNKKDMEHMREILRLMDKQKLTEEEQWRLQRELQHAKKGWCIIS